MLRLLLQKKMRYLVVLLIVPVFFACANQGRTTPTQQLDIQPTVPSVRYSWAAAMDVAQSWRSDAYVASVTTDVILPNDFPHAVIVSFQVLSPSEDYIELVVYCKGKSCDSDEVEHELEVMQVSPITLDDFLLDSGEALELGLRQGGEEYAYREDGSNDGHDLSALVQLSRQFSYGTGAVHWRVLFSDISLIDGTGEGVDLMLDATTGEVVKIEGK